ncbi:MAG: sn-glycerol-3-phosphate ABC transporter ATP-binding protein UgpC, partial [Pseudomonadota bacterium]
MPRIRLDGLVKRYGDVEVLHGVDLELADKEFTVLVGPSGCGKSTTLRMIAGLESITEGEIYFEDKPIGHLPSKDRDIAMVFQDYALYPHMNIERNMSFALRLKRVPKAEINEKVKRVADMLHIGHLLQRKPAELSGGQRQRVAMGRALVRDAPTFLFDEPLSNLDAKLRLAMRTELAEMRAQLDKNMIYVTHDQVEAMTLGDRIVVMSDGRVQQQGTAEELFKRPANKFVAGFIGSPTMNFLDAAVETENDDAFVAGNGFRFKCNTAQSAALNARNDRDVTVGVRPSAFSTELENASSITLDIIVSEYLGAQSILATRCAGQDVLVEYDSDSPIDRGGSMTFGVRSEDIHLFDARTGQTI